MFVMVSTKYIHGNIGTVRGVNVGTVRGVLYSIGTVKGGIGTGTV